MLTSGTVFGHYIFPNILDFPDLVAEDQRVLAELVTGAIFRDATVGEAAKGFVAGSLYDVSSLVLLVEAEDVVVEVRVGV
eukprot:2983843-Rhodomonas_salina.3